jgi:uncharacterized protein YdiU (UPF0061 family)
MGVGFIHGVMNTDNMAISGETIDYGPCAFMDVYNEATVFSSIDRRGRYAYGNQPKIAHWNLAQFAASLIPLVAANEATAVAKVEEVLAKFPALYEHAWLRRMGQKLGFAKVEASDKDLINGFLQVLQTCEADFTNGFRDLAFDPLPELTGSEDFKAWRTEWEARLAAENTPLLAARQRMKNVNPRVIPRNHLVEKALTAASAQNDLTLIHALLAVLRNPFGEGAPTPYCTPPLPGEVVQATFCGT